MAQLKATTVNGNLTLSGGKLCANGQLQLGYTDDTTTSIWVGKDNMTTHILGPLSIGGRLDSTENVFVIGKYGNSISFASNRQVYLDTKSSSSSPKYWGPISNSYLIYAVVNYSATIYCNISYSGNQTLSSNVTFGIYVGSTRIGSKTITMKSTGSYLPSSNNYGVTFSATSSNSLGSFTNTISPGNTVSFKYEYNTGVTSSLSGSTITTSNTSSATGSVTWAGDSYVGLSDNQSQGSGTIFIAPNSSAASVFTGSTTIGCVGARGRHISLGSAGVELAYIQQPTNGWTTTSDIRDKTDFKSIENSLMFVNTLNPVTFVDNHRDKYKTTTLTDKYDDNGNQISEVTFDNDAYEKCVFKGNRRIAGFKAQDVYNSMIDIYSDSNYASIVDHSRYDDDTCVDDRYYMRYTQLIPFLTGAIQELSAKLDSATKKINELENTISELKK